MIKAKPQQSNKEPEDFESVAKRVGCDPDLKTFDKKLGKIARASSKNVTRNGHPKR
jgi:hypothetical protein